MYAIDDTLLYNSNLSQPRRALIEGVLSKKACTSLSEGRTQTAQLLFNYLFQASVRTSAVEWGHICTLSLSGTPVFNDISTAITPANPLMLVRSVTH